MTNTPAPSIQPTPTNLPRKRRKRVVRRKSQPWIKIRWTWHWRSLAAVVYLTICVFDLVAMPLYREYTYTKLPIEQMVAIAAKMPDAASQVEVLKTLKEDRPWTPLTNSTFHIAFGAILGVSALPMNRDEGAWNQRRRTYSGHGDEEEDDNEDNGDDDHHGDDISDDNSNGNLPTPAPHGDD